MAIKFEKIEPGMTLLDIHSEQMGNTTIRQLGCWDVKVISVDKEKRSALVSWNGNPSRVWYQRQLERLYREDKEPKRYRDQQERRKNGGCW